MKTVVRFAAVLVSGFAIQTSGAQAASETVVYSFSGYPDDGNGPGAALIDVGGTLYGTTVSGGAGGCCGTVFSINPTSGKEKVLYSFGGAGTDDGESPLAPLLNVGGILYGTTKGGGTHGDGTVFSFDPATARETVLFSFKRKNGTAPVAGLRNFDGMLYGTTAFGGANIGNGCGGMGCGTVFSLDPGSGVEAIVHSFDGTDGQYPLGALVKVGGALYGTTSYGGTGGCSQGCGTVFSIDLATGKETVVHNFESNEADGNHPAAALTKVNDILYGTTRLGGAHRRGTIFSIDPATGEEKVLYSFRWRTHRNFDGWRPDAALVDVGSTLYGTTYSGGTRKGGTVFAFKPASGWERLLYSFEGADGEEPVAPLLDAGGTLYGTTGAGGRHGFGTVYAIRVSARILSADSSTLARE